MNRLPNSITGTCSTVNSSGIGLSGAECSEAILLGPAARIDVDQSNDKYTIAGLPQSMLSTNVESMPATTFISVSGATVSKNVSVLVSELVSQPISVPVSNAVSKPVTKPVSAPGVRVPVRGVHVSVPAVVHISEPVLLLCTYQTLLQSMYQNLSQLCMYLTQSKSM